MDKETIENYLENAKTLLVDGKAVLAYNEIQFVLNELKADKLKEHKDEI